jgi:hypothetical protein
MAEWLPGLLFQFKLEYLWFVKYLCAYEMAAEPDYYCTALICSVWRWQLWHALDTVLYCCGVMV